MAPTSGRSRTALNRQLLDEAYRFDFFQAVRLLERMGREPSPEGSLQRQFPVGQDHLPRQEVVRFRANPSHSFPAGPISEIRPPRRGTTEAAQPSPLEMVVACMGLTGPNGALPRHYTAMLIQRVRNKDYALCDFLDLFNHRIISLFYRAWEKYRFAISYERCKSAEDQPQEDLFTHCLYCLLGLGTEGLGGRLEFDDEALLYYGGHFAHYPRSAVSLASVLEDYFELPVDVRQFQGQWLYLDEDDLSSLPCPARPRGLNCRIGTEVVIGERVWDVRSKFRVRLGPLGYRQFRRFIPSGDALRPLCQMVRFHVGPQFDFDVQPVLMAEEVPWCRLGGDGDDPSRLGWNTWIRCGQFDHDVADAVFSLEGEPWFL